MRSICDAWATSSTTIADFFDTLVEKCAGRGASANFRHRRLEKGFKAFIAQSELESPRRGFRALAPMTVPQHHRVHRSSVSFTLETPEESTKSEEQHGQAASYYPSGLAIDTIFPGPDMVGIDRFIKDGVIGIPGCPPRHLRSGAGCFSSDPTRQDIDPITGTIIQRGFPSNPCAPARWRSQGWELDCKQSLPDLVEELAELAKIVDRPLVSPRRRRVDALRTHRPRRATAPIRVPVQKGNRG